MDFWSQVWKRVWEMAFLVWNWVWIWRCGRPPPTKNSKEYPPGHQNYDGNVFQWRCWCTIGSTKFPSLLACIGFSKVRREGTDKESKDLPLPSSASLTYPLPWPDSQFSSYLTCFVASYANVLMIRHALLTNVWWNTDGTFRKISWPDHAEIDQKNQSAHVRSL